jgi:hypothetical protein
MGKRGRFIAKKRKLNEICEEKSISINLPSHTESVLTNTSLVLTMDQLANQWKGVLSDDCEFDSLAEIEYPKTLHLNWHNTLQPDALLFASLLVDEYTRYLCGSNINNDDTIEYIKRVGDRRPTKQLIYQYLEKHEVITLPQLKKLVDEKKKKRNLSNFVNKLRARKFLAHTEPIWISERHLGIEDPQYRFVLASSQLSWEHVICRKMLEKTFQYFEDNPESISIQSISQHLNIGLNQTKFLFSYLLKWVRLVGLEITSSNSNNVIFKVTRKPNFFAAISLSETREKIINDINLSHIERESRSKDNITLNLIAGDEIGIKEQLYTKSKRRIVHQTDSDSDLDLDLLEENLSQEMNSEVTS